MYILTGAGTGECALVAFPPKAAKIIIFNTKFIIVDEKFIIFDAKFIILSIPTEPVFGPA